MKKLLLIVVSIFLSILSNAQSFNLTVNKGYGSGTYNIGDTVHIWSRATLGDSVFVKWQGNGSSFLLFDDEWHTRLVVPAGSSITDLEITALYDSLPSDLEIMVTTLTLKGSENDVWSDVEKEVYRYIPENPKGIVFFMHGTNGSAEGAFTRFEGLNLIKDLAYNGYGTVSISANEVTVGDQAPLDGQFRWQARNSRTANTSNNVDLKNIELLRDSIIDIFSLPTDVACFSIGVSNGSNFSDLCASALRFNASAHITGKGLRNTYNRDDIAPVIWIMSDNDNNGNANNDTARVYFDILKEKQTTEWYLLERSPLFRQRFARSLNGISISQSNAISTKLFTEGHVDSETLFLSSLLVSDIPDNFYNEFSLSPAQREDVSMQLLATNADHVTHSDYSKRIIDFFDATFEPVAVKEVVKKEYLSIYPNPTQDWFEIKNHLNGSFKVIVRDLSGKELKRNSMDKKTDISDLERGVYLIDVTMNGKKSTQKLIKN